MPGKPPQQDEAAARVKEGEVDVVPALLADAQPLEVVEPGQRAFHDPPVSAEPLTRLDTSARNTRDDAALAKTAPDVRVVVPLVTVSLLGPLARLTSASVVDRPDGVQQRQRTLLVVDVRCCQQHRQRTAPLVRHDMVLGALLPSVRGVRAGLGPPFSPGRCRSGTPHAASRCAPGCPAHPAVAAGAARTPRHAPTRPADASRWCRSRQKPRPAGPPRRCLS